MIDCALAMVQTTVSLPAWFGLVAAGMIGACVGSFLNVVIWRLPRNCLSIVKPRSFCPKCREAIAAYDNIPVVSYVLLGGRCRHCRTPISLRYPAIEALTAALFVAAVWVNAVRGDGLVLEAWPWVSVLTWWIFIALMIAAALIDAELTVIPNVITWGGTVALLALAALNPLHGGAVWDSHSDKLEAPPGAMVVKEGDTESVVRVEQRRAPMGAASQEMRVLERRIVGAQRFARVGWQSPAADLVAPPPVVRDPETDAIVLDNLSGESPPKSHARSFLGALFGALIAGGLMWLLRGLATGMMVKKALRYGQGSAMGLGDVKLLALIGAMVGWPAALMSIFGGAVIGLIVSVPMLLAKKQHLFPFGPFLAASALILLFIAGPLMSWLVNNYAPLFGY